MKFKALCFVVALLTAPVSQAAFVTLPEAGMDAVFSQAAFGNTPIDIRFGPVTTIVAPTLLDITSDAEIGQVFGLHVGPQDVGNFYFVDTISSCGVINPNIIGCGETPGQDFVVESVWAADPTLGPLLLAHELGHNLGLPHNNTNNTFLMWPFLDGGTLFNATEVATILASPLVHIDPTNGQRFITINPVLIVASAPEPSTMLLLATGLLFAGMRSRKLRFFR